MNNYSQMYAKRVDNIRNLKLERERVYDALKGQVEGLAGDIVRRFEEEFLNKEAKELRATLNGILYHIIRIEPKVEDWGHTIMVGIDILVERIDNYTPTDAELKLLKRRPKSRYKSDMMTAAWIDNDVHIWEWTSLKNKIFQKFTYRWDLFENGIEGKITNQKLNLKPVK